jgi:hypothetical protein
MGPSSFMGSVADRNVVMRRIPVYSSHKRIVKKTQPKQWPTTHTNYTKTSDFPTALNTNSVTAQGSEHLIHLALTPFVECDVRSATTDDRKQTDVCGNAMLSEQHCPGYRRCYGPSSSRSCRIDVLVDGKVDFKQHIIAPRITNVNRGHKN